MERGLSADGSSRSMSLSSPNRVHPEPAMEQTGSPTPLLGDRDFDERSDVPAMHAPDAKRVRAGPAGQMPGPDVSCQAAHLNVQKRATQSRELLLYTCHVGALK